MPVRNLNEALAGVDVPLERDVPLGPLTWYGVGGKAALLARPRDEAQLAALVQRCRSADVPVYVLGSGANLLVSDVGVDAVVVRLDAEPFVTMRVDGTAVTAGGGFDLFKLVLETARAGLSGLETVAGIPATVGGAVRMNAGGAYGEIGGLVRRVRVMNRAGEVYDRHRDGLRFEYRRSNVDEPIILEVEFELAEDDPDDLMRRVKEIFLYKKSTQPMADASAGCAFKNPREQSELSAGALIDRAGLKGFRLGGAEVSKKHANFIVTHAGCTASDVLAVIEHVQQTVQQRFGVTLEREVVVWP